MKMIETIIVPQNKCPLDVLAEMGERVRESWIFLHKNCIEKLVKSADCIGEINQEIELCWNETDKCPATTIVVDSDFVWRQVYKIQANDIAFSYKTNDPSVVLFMKMEE